MKIRNSLPLLLLTLVSCSSKLQSDLDFDPNEPLRVAVLPFARIDEKGNFIPEEGRLIVDNLSLISSDISQTPAQIVRKQVLQELKKTGLDLISLPLIDVDLPHNGFAKSDLSIDLEKLYKSDPGQLCTKFLNCEAVIYGKVFDWDRSYYGIQSVNSVGIDLKLVSAKTKKTLFSSRASDSESRGISKGPTGYSSLVLEPIKGLDSQINVDLSRKVVTQMLKPLDTTQSPEFLQSEAPAIFGASHDVTDGVLKKELVVVMMGSPAQTASFSIGKKIRDIPMFERSPGHYYGEYLPWAGESFGPSDVTTSLKDKFGRVTFKKIALAPVALK